MRSVSTPFIAVRIGRISPAVRSVPATGRSTHCRIASSACCVFTVSTSTSSGSRSTSSGPDATSTRTAECSSGVRKLRPSCRMASPFSPRAIRSGGCSPPCCASRAASAPPIAPAPMITYLMLEPSSLQPATREHTLRREFIAQGRLGRVHRPTFTLPFQTPGHPIAIQEGVRRTRRVRAIEPHETTSASRVPELRKGECGTSERGSTRERGKTALITRGDDEGRHPGGCRPS